MKHVTQQRLKEIFTYKQGKLYWLKSKSPRINIGDIAGTLNKTGYQVISIKGKKYLSHRLIWLYHYGYLPKYIDHKYGKEIGDYLWNLRSCTHSQNLYNAKTSKSNTSGVKGVMWSKSCSKWLVRIATPVGRDFGSYKDLELAALVAHEVRDKYHGKFARN